MVNDPQVPVAENVVETELDLGKAVAESFTEHKYNFVMVTPTNLDAIMEIYLNTPEEIPFVIDLYQFRILSKAIQGRRDWFKMYGPRITKDGKIKVTVKISNQSNRCPARTTSPEPDRTDSSAR